MKKCFHILLKLIVSLTYFFKNEPRVCRLACVALSARFIQIKVPVTDDFCLYHAGSQSKCDAILCTSPANLHFRKFETENFLDNDLSLWVFWIRFMTRIIEMLQEFLGTNISTHLDSSHKSKVSGILTIPMRTALKFC